MRRELNDKAFRAVSAVNRLIVMSAARRILRTENSKSYSDPKPRIILTGGGDGPGIGPSLPRKLL